MTQKNTISRAIKLYSDETVEDLQRSGFRLIQPTYGFRFGEDSVMLAAIASDICQSKYRSKTIADLGAGSGAVSFLMAARNPFFNFVAVEYDQHRFNCLSRNIKLNKLEERMIAIEADIHDLAYKAENKQKWPELLIPKSCDFVVMNPPYRLATDKSKLQWEKGDRRICSSLLAAEEIGLTLADLMKVTARLLKPYGIMVMVHRPHRLPDIIECMRKYKIEPIGLQPLESISGRVPSRIIVTGRLHGKSGGFKWQQAIVICNKAGEYTEEVKNMYGNEPAMPEKYLWEGLENKSDNWQ